MATDPTIHMISLTTREVVLIRVALLVRMDRLRERPEHECQMAYEDSRSLMMRLWPYVRDAKPSEVV